ncbi:hypothetical protein QMZ92_06065 [Streptomyces sp. HNM0645]|uniref:allene oxide cyclase barrel-like domain-containing protein n=1 Tax=Streptomyces sp. HNM0645 TaxID=2782343 RepID=UPI0024B71DF2|nr:hypothetical protein [Streptomyces sp. HNM0645]MDI9883967.1 hypothetical protein [Streptomyces sp. HNM0645]
MNLLRPKGALAVGALALSAAMLTPATAMATEEATPGGGKVLDIVSQTTGAFGVPPAAVAGTQFGFTGENYLYDTGKPFGTFGVQCLIMAVEAPDAVSQCIETFDTPRGQITVQGIKTDPDNEQPDEFTEAVTGGTGHYAHVTGYADFSRLDDSSYRVVFHLRNVK